MEYFLHVIYVLFYTKSTAPFILCIYGILYACIIMYYNTLT